MRFKTKDLLVTILPKHTVVGHADEILIDNCAEATDCACDNTGKETCECWVTVSPTGKLGCVKSDWDVPDDLVGRPGALDVESHRRELKARLKALDAYQAALEEEPSGAELDEALDRLKADEARLEAALEGIRSAQQQVEEKRGQTEEED